jgi:hypothetical protein
MKSMRAFLLFTLSLLFVLQTHAARLVLLTDQPSARAAKLTRNLILQTQPFSLLKPKELTIEIQVLDPVLAPIQCHATHVQFSENQIASMVYEAKEMGLTLTDNDLKIYRDGYDIARLVKCDSARLAVIGAQFQADHILFIHDSPFEGGSGGDVPVVLAGSRETIGLHEWLHTFGLADEYAYAKQEAPFYCRKKDWVNIAIFNDEPPYSGSRDVRARLAEQVPWLKWLSPQAVLSHDGQLGTPEIGATGIFHAKTCQNLEPMVRAWQSAGQTTIMESALSNYIPKTWWPTILSGLGVSPARIGSLMRTKVKSRPFVSQVYNPANPTSFE